MNTYKNNGRPFKKRADHMNNVELTAWDSHLFNKTAPVSAEIVKGAINSPQQRKGTKAKTHGGKRRMPMNMTPAPIRHRP